MKNKISRVQQGAKIKVASGYQEPTTRTLITFDKKRKIQEEESSITNDITIIAESANIKKKKTDYNCSTCNICFDTSNSLRQHKRSQKHEKNR